MRALKFTLVAVNAQKMHAQFPARKSTAFPHGQGYLEAVSFPVTIMPDHARVMLGSCHGNITRYPRHLLEETNGQAKVRYLLN